MGTFSSIGVPKKRSCTHGDNIIFYKYVQNRIFRMPGFNYILKNIAYMYPYTGYCDKSEKTKNVYLAIHICTMTIRDIYTTGVKRQVKNPIFHATLHEDAKSQF